MPHHIEDGDNVAASMVTMLWWSCYARQWKWKLYKSFRTCWFWQMKNLVRCASDEECEQKNSKYGWTNDPATSKSSVGMLGISPETGVMEHGFVSLTANEYKEHHQRSSMALIPGLKKYNLLLLPQTFQLWISTSIAPNTSPLWRYYIRNSLLIREVVPDQRWDINEGRNYLVYWV